MSELFFGLVGPDLKDTRDHIKEIRDGSIVPVDLAQAYNIRPSDQGRTNSCTGHSVAKLLEACTVKQKTPIPRFSANFSYLSGRMDRDLDSGAGLRPALMGAVRVGGIEESNWADGSSPVVIPSHIEKWPTERTYRLPSVERVVGAESLLRVLSLERVPVVTGIALQRNATTQMTRKGYAPEYNPSDPVIGYHAELAVGWDFKGSDVWVKWVGSWGYGVGLAGCYWRPLSYVENEVVVDMWTVGKEFF